jgi:hypothetical protein
VCAYDSAHDGFPGAILEGVLQSQEMGKRG